MQFGINHFMDQLQVPALCTVADMATKRPDKKVRSEALLPRVAAGVGRWFSLSLQLSEMPSLLGMSINDNNKTLLKLSHSRWMPMRCTRA